MPDDFLDMLLAELRSCGYRAEGLFEVLATVVSERSVFGLRYKLRRGVALSCPR